MRCGCLAAGAHRTTDEASEGAQRTLELGKAEGTRAYSHVWRGVAWLVLRGLQATVTRLRERSVAMQQRLAAQETKQAELNERVQVRVMVAWLPTLVVTV